MKMYVTTRYENFKKLQKTWKK